MKNILILLLTISGLAVQAQVSTISLADIPAKKAPSTFEGIVKITDTEKIGFTGEYIVRKHQVASTIPLGEDKKIKKILDNNERSIITLKKKKGDKLAIKTLRERNTQKAPAQITMSVSEETKKIGNYNCTKVIANDDNTKVEAWVTSDLDINLGEILTNQNRLQMINKLTSRQGVAGTILKMTRTDIATGTKTEMAVTVQSKKIKDKAFKIPKGYKLIDRTRKSNSARSMPSASSFKGVTNRAYEIQKKVREGKMEKPADGTAPAQEAAPAPKKEK